MNGYVYVIGKCFTCKFMFSFNPHKVPSLRVAGIREPICLDCMTLGNKKREEMGLAPHPINQDAYEAIREEEL